MPGCQLSCAVIMDASVRVDTSSCSLPAKDNCLICLSDVTVKSEPQLIQRQAGSPSSVDASSWYQILVPEWAATSKPVLLSLLLLPYLLLTAL